MSTASPKPAKPVYHLAALLIMAATTLWYLFPLFQNFDQAFIASASNGDAMQYFWNAWVFKTNLHSGLNPFYTHAILQPEGTNLLMHTYTPLMSIYCLFFDNLLVGVNSFLVLNFFLSAVGAYWLTFRFTRQILPSILVGIFFAFCPYKMQHLIGHYNLMLTAVMPFYILLFLHTFTFEYGKFFPSVKNKASLVGVFFLGLLCALSDFYNTFFVLYFSVLFSLYYKVQPLWVSMSTTKKGLSVILLFTTMHFIVNKLVAAGLDDKGGIFWGADLLAYFIPNGRTWLWDRNWFGPLVSYTEKTKGSSEFQMFIGYSMILLAGYIIYVAFRKKIPATLGVWIFILFVFLMISLPSFRVAGIHLFYTPTSILHFIPFFNNLRCPARIIVMISLILPLIGMVLWANSYTDKKYVYWKNGTLVLLMIWCGLELQPIPIKIFNINRVPQIIASVKESGVKTLLPIPLGVRDGMQGIGFTNSNLLFYQTIHQKPTMGGYISRVPKSAYDQYRNDSVCARLMRCTIDSTYLAPDPSEEEKARFFSIFHPDGFLILPEYKNGSAEKYIMTLIEGRKYKRIEKDGVFIQLE